MLYSIVHILNIFTDTPLGFQSWIQGVLFILCIYHFLLYFQSKNRVFLYYSSFVFCVLISFVHYGPEMFYTRWLPEERLNLSYTFEFLSYYFFIAYGRTLLETKTHLPKWDKVLKIGQTLILVVVAPIGFFIPLLAKDAPFNAFVIMIIISLMSIFTITMSYVFFRYLNSIPTKLFILGSFVYTISNTITLISLGDSTFKHYLPNVDSYVFLETGAIFESLLFALVIRYRIHEIEQEKKETQLQVLQKSVEASTLKAEASEAKIIAFKAQMNPHFIFNALNSINTFILKNNTEKASDYLIDFSKLIRRILKNSTETTVSLQEEMETIEKYILLEEMRIQNGFSFMYNCSPNINLNQIMVPPLFLQPYIENAIRHGLSGPKKNKKLTLSITSTINYIKVRIEDNGKGRKAAKALNLNLSKKSFGTTITQERIKALDKNASVVTTDCIDPYQNICGTAVVITLSKQPI